MRTVFALAVVALYYFLVYAAVPLGLAALAWGMVMRRAPAEAQSEFSLTPQQEGRNLILLGAVLVAVGIAIDYWHFFT